MSTTLADLRLPDLRPWSWCLEPFCQTALRVPGLFLLDYWLRHLAGEWLPDAEAAVGVAPWAWLYTLATTLVPNALVLMFALTVMASDLNFLMPLYTNLFHVAVIYATEQVSGQFIEEEMQDNREDRGVILFLGSLLSQTLSLIGLSGLFTLFCLYPLEWRVFWAQFPLLFALPVLTRLLCVFGLPTWSLVWAHKLPSVMVTLYIYVYSFFLVAVPIVNKWWSTVPVVRFLISVQGHFNTALILSHNLADPIVILVYWMAMVIDTAYQESFEVFQYEPASPSYSFFAPLLFLMTVISKVCISPLSLIATCVAVMAASKLALRWTLSYTVWCSQSQSVPQPAVDTSGLAEGVMLFFMSLQCGLLDQTDTERLASMIIIFYVVSGSLLQSMLELVQPVMLALAGGSRRMVNHIKILSLWLVLFLIPSYTSYLVLSTVGIDVWTTVIISNSLLVSIQALGLLIHYLLYLYDSTRPEPLDAIDDLIYYLKAVVHSLELLSALFVIGVAAREYFNGTTWSKGTAVFLLVYSYFGVWLQVKKGWKSFLLRQAAAVKMESLDSATDVQLATYNDVCAICYSEMTAAAKITPCAHIFHVSCLRKWLFVQDQCPLCSAKVIEQGQGHGQGHETDEESLAEEEVDEE